MEDDQSTNVAEATPAEDPILSALSDDADTPSVDTSTEDTSDDVVDETPKEEVSDAEAESEVEQPKEGESEDQAIDPKEEARRRYEERQAFREEQRAKIAEQTKEYSAEAQDDYDQRLRAVEIQRYTEMIENTQDKLVSEFERAKVNPDLQIFNPDSPEFNQKIYDKAIRDYNSGYITYDENGNMVGLKSSLYEHLNETADLYKDATKSGQIQQVRASRQMRATSDVKPASSPKAVEKDAIADILSSD